MENSDYAANPQVEAALTDTVPAASNVAAVDATSIDTAAEFASSFTDRLDDEGIYYEVVGQTVLTVSYPTAEEGVCFDVTVIFDTDGVPEQKVVVGQGGYAAAHVRLRNWDLGDFADSDRRDDAIIACNHLNNLYHWVKFSVTSDGAVTSAVDFVVNAKSGNDEILRLLGLMTEICVDARLAFELVKDGLAPAFLTSVEPVSKEQMESAVEEITSAEGGASVEGDTSAETGASV